MRELEQKHAAAMADVEVKLASVNEQKDNSAIEHIQKFGTQHTDAIMTENEEIAKVFTNAVDSAIVLVNASTQFADGGEYCWSVIM